LHAGSQADIDVHELHQGYLRQLQSRGGIVTARAQVVGLEHSAGTWSVTTAGGTLRARIVVNAAGAWAGEVGMLAGAHEVGLQPLKRTACLIGQPPGLNADLWPILIDVAEQFYLKQVAGMLLLSPADETLTGPCDVQADDLDIAITVDRIERATTLDVKRVTHKWAGLRSFLQDCSPVVGYDPHRPGFFWLATLGGYAIQIAASLVLDLNLVEDLLARGINLRELSPSRLMPNREEINIVVERAG
jgi:D-arginine dehydrogenase